MVARNPEVLEDYNRIQLRKGLGRDGRTLLLYRDDPYFKGDLEWADGYAKWKQSLGRSDPDKPYGAADFYINGYTHSYITVTVKAESAVFNAEVPWADSIQDKTHGRAFGLTDQSKSQYRNEFLLPEMAKSIKEKTGAK